MNRKNRSILVASQLVIILAFFAGMLLNYFALLPTIVKGEDSRIIAELDGFCTEFYLNGVCDFDDEVMMDSLAADDPYKEGDFIIMNSKAEILYSKNGVTGDVYGYLNAKYGKLATDLLEAELKYPEGISRTDYDAMNFTSFYASYVPPMDKVFFYAIDYRVASSDVFDRFYFLLAFMVVGGIVVILICHSIIKRVSEQVRRESLVQQELDTASTVQRSMLPRGKKHMIQIDVDARLLPAKNVSGDFYCYVLRNGKFFFCIGDVSGKGVPASLFMSRAVTLFRACAYSEMTAGEMAGYMNRELCLNNDQNMFLTAIMGVMYPFDGQMTYVNAGHEPPVIWDGKEESSLQYLESRGNVPFGIAEDVEFFEESYEIGKNGLLLLYTDGVSEAKSRERGFLGRERLLQLLEPVKSMSSEKINDSLLNCISKHETGIEQSDDITLLTFRNIANPKKLVIRNEISELKKISPFTVDIFRECLADSKDHAKVRAGLDEALTNCVRYAYSGPGNEIEVTASVENRSLTFTIKDSGIPFNPLEYSPEPSDELKVGGLGIPMYRSIFDDVRYSREDGCNILKLTKKLI